MYFYFNTGFLLFLVALAAPSAAAYIDPGTGGLMVQALIGALATGLLTIKVWWQQVINLFSSKSEEK